MPGAEVINGSIIDLYLNERPSLITMPDLMGKTREEVSQILDELDLQYTFNGAGKVINQNPEAGENLNKDTNIVIELSEG